MQAAPLLDGWNAVAGVDATVYGNVQTWLGGIITVLGGGRAAWQAAHGKDFTGELISAIAGVCLLAASGWAGLDGQLGAATQETTQAGHTVSLALGGIVTVIGGGLTAWKLVHGERATGYLVCAIAGVCIAAASVI
jgi:hypothetical protein